MPEAMSVIRAELGNDAVILNSKIIYTGGILGFFKKKSLEVIAAVDPKQSQYDKPVVKNKKVQHSKPQSESAANLAIEKSISTVQKPSKDLLKEINELKSLLTKLPAKGESLSSGIPDTIREVLYMIEKQEISKVYQEELLEVLLEHW